MMHRPAIFIALAMSLCAAVTAVGSNAAPTDVPTDIRVVFGKPLYRDATWGLRVQDGSRVLVDLNSNRQFLVGSVRKIFSVGANLNAVGAAHTYDTPVYRQGRIDNNKVLHGNLVLVASGDLTMGGRANPDGTVAISNWDHNEADGLGNAILTRPDPLAGYRRLARAVKASGIDRVAGDVVIDDRLFTPFDFRGQFQVRPIFVNDDAVDITIVPQKTPRSRGNVTWRPKSAALGIDNRLVTGAARSENTLAIGPELPACIGSAGCTSTVKGSLPSDFVPPLTGKPEVVRTVRIVQPANYARTVFVEALRAAGVAVDAPSVEPNPVHFLASESSYSAPNLVAKLTGLPYGQDAKLVLKISYNIGADTSLVLFGLTRGVHSMPDALRAERENLATAYGIPSAQYHFIDGSGGGDTTATNVAVTRMLEQLAEARQHQPFFDALPVLGVDGSLAFVKAYQKDRTLAGATGQVHAKTGTYVAGSEAGAVLKGQALGGYITTKSGKHLTFELVVNNVPIKGIPDVVKVFEDEGTVAAMLWRDY
ncbi:MAG: D-alanyl-D-alanine carboxypeptidase [Candidatus Eremiobacteraeota bacterium]|nr:D-alanyl-D-alanine carboxypeptidase [Candidatus Eremiobacteraeota bacterium]